MNTAVNAAQPTTEVSRIEINDPRRRLAFVPQLFATPVGERLAINFLSRHSNYDGGMWNFYEVPVGLTGRVGPWAGMIINHPTGYIAPADGVYRLTIPGNYFDAEVSADAAGIIATLFVLNHLSWKASELGKDYALTCQRLIERQDALKDYICIIQHPEKSLIFQAID